MINRNTMLVTMAALALAGGCKKKDKAEDKPATPTPTDQPAKPDPAARPDQPAAAKLTGEALGKAFVATWDAWNAGDKAKFTAAYAPDAIGHRPDQDPDTMKGAEAMVKDAFDFRAAFPDAKGTPQLVLVNDRMVAAAVLITGTNTAPMPMPTGDMPPTGKKVGILVFHGVAYNDANLVTEEWWVMDNNSFASQLGLSPQPGRPVQDQGQGGAPVIVVATGSDTEKANLAAANKGNDDFNKHDLAASMAAWADDGIESDQASPADTVGKAGIEANAKMFMGAFSDGKITPVVAFAAGDYVFMAATFVGTNDGDMGPMKKTGKNVKATVVEFSKFEGGKVKQLWRFFDSVAMMKQMMDAPPSATQPAKMN